MSDIIAAITVLALVVNAAFTPRPEPDSMNSSQSGQAHVTVIRPAKADEKTYGQTPKDRRREEEVTEGGVLVRLRVIDHE